MRRSLEDEESERLAAERAIEVDLDR
jgi:hypothetical protein